ncbi:sugar nucleotide-binding protein [Microbacterium sp.]|uniref:sugar nucleotide-binding protein n=1 Tax=Microbacterium sp. TaxID=51671 RepID=UPI0039E2D710
MTGHDRRPGATLLVGCGKVGVRLGLRLYARGESVIALRRTTDGLPPVFQAVAVDLDAPAREPLPQVDSVVVTLPPRRGEGAGYRAQLEHLSAALPERPSRVIFVSSTGVFDGKDPGHALTERDLPQPASDRARELLAGERAAVELFDAIIVRPAGIYGPGREYLLRQVRAAAPVDYVRRTNRIHEVDLVRALDLLLTLADPPALVHAVDAAPAPLGDVVRFLAAELHVAPPPAAEPGRDGIELDGSLLRSLLGELEYPDYRTGYRAVLSGRD